MLINLKPIKLTHQRRKKKHSLINIFSKVKGKGERKLWLQFQIVVKFHIYIYIYMRSVQVTYDVTLKSYTFSKPLDLSESNGKKKNILMAIF